MANHALKHNQFVKRLQTEDNESSENADMQLVDLKGNILLPAKIGERVGKIKAKYPAVGKYYEIELQTSDDGKKELTVKFITSEYLALQHIAMIVFTEF